MFAPGSAGTTQINYINCSNNLITIPLDSRTTPFQICCLYPNAPYFTSGPSGWDFEITSNGCNCTLP